MPERAQTRSPKTIGIVAGLAALAVAGVGIATRSRSEHRLAGWTGARAVPVVSVIHPARSTDTGALTLPANLQALNSAPIFARTSGYVRRWYVDIGDRVKAGQVLAVLDAPEVEQQLVAARADLKTAQANQQLAASTAARWQTMLAKDAVSKQETDEKVGDLAAKTAVTDASRANVARLQFTQGFTRLIAPFGGVVTQRSTDIGALVSAGTAAATPLFTVADVSRMRAFIRVPQSYSAQVHPGMHVALTLPEYAGRQFDAVLTRTAGAVDPRSGTVLTELQAANGDRALKPGAYAQASLPLAGASGAVTLPASALIIGQHGTQVALLGTDGRAHLRTITIGQDRGATVAVSAGLTAADRVIDSPPDSLADGDAVQVSRAG
jgi:RND family efflux transporter MFP subunit